MEGGFNDVSLQLMPGASEEEVIARLDRIARPLRRNRRHPRAACRSPTGTLDNELAQLQSFGFLIPVIFLGVAAFLLNVCLTRARRRSSGPRSRRSRRSATRNREIGWHYVKWCLVIATLGAGIGIVGGRWLGAGMISLYNQFFRFPILLYRLSGDVAVMAALIALAAGGLGALLAVRRAVSCPRPRPCAPSRRRTTAPASSSGRGSSAGSPTPPAWSCATSSATPGAPPASVVGISFAVGILLFGFVFLDAMELLADLQFDLVQRQDVTVTFVEPVSSRALHEIESLPGV